MLKEEVQAQAKELAKIDKEIAEHEATIEKAGAALKESRARRKTFVGALRQLVGAYRVFHPKEVIDIPGLEAPKARGGDGQPKKRRTFEENAKLVLAALREPAHYAKVAELAEMSPANVSQVLRRLEEDGRVARLGEGRWRKVDQQAAAPTSIARTPHRMETIERHPNGFMCPKCRQVRKSKLEFAEFDCKPR